ncbi:hypothetical protein AVEN_242087-1 [Araneus ventricosus]|uniref:Uncharacterized protein n=1 Tax=Araneus ventricosus TaxID=182803 RepID=A0A4Y2PI23_ARAVE|nr:hypothetical protein AVEN_242087-1 [Araneus ventricosus]
MGRRSAWFPEDIVDCGVGDQNDWWSARPKWLRTAGLGDRVAHMSGFTIGTFPSENDPPNLMGWKWKRSAKGYIRQQRCVCIFRLPRGNSFVKSL